MAMSRVFLGSCHRALRTPRDGRPGVRLGRAHHRKRRHRVAASVRAAGQGVDLTNRVLEI